MAWQVELKLLPGYTTRKAYFVEREKEAKDSAIAPSCIFRYDRIEYDWPEPCYDNFDDAQARADELNALETSIRGDALELKKLQDNYKLALQDEDPNMAIVAEAVLLEWLDKQYGKPVVDSKGQDIIKGGGLLQFLPLMLLLARTCHLTALINSDDEERRQWQRRALIKLYTEQEANNELV